MSAPTAAVRAKTYERDENRCVSCGRTDGLQYQHRAAEGMGGREAAPLLDEGLTTCWSCNPWYEAQGQAQALVKGWKVRRWVVEQGLAFRVPVFYVPERRWCLLGRDGLRMPLPPTTAEQMIRDVYGEPEWAEMVRRAA